MAFASIYVHKNKTLQENRNSIYLQALTQLIRIIPTDSKLLILENTGFLTKPQRSESANQLRTTLRNVDVLSLSDNSGKVNKGIGELDMLSAYMSDFKTDHIKRVVFATMRQIHLSPYAIDRILNSDKPMVLSNPDFFFLDGRKSHPGSTNQFNDMCFGGNLEEIKQYAEYFLERRDSMIEAKTSSEQLLWRYVQDSRVNYETLDQLGIVRCAGDDMSKINTWHYI